MIITILSIVILAVGILMTYIDKHAYKRSCPYWVYPVSCILITVGAIVLFFSAILILGQVINLNDEYEAAVYEKQVLEARLDHLEDNPYSVGNEYLYHDIVKYNNNLRHVKYWANNPWTSWFNNHKIASIDYIDIPILNE